jgi:hypothetical protein
LEDTEGAEVPSITMICPPEIFTGLPDEKLMPLLPLKNQLFIWGCV